jgi:hypothetical protein
LKLGTAKYGASQGSILGPLHFPTFKNDLPVTLKALLEPTVFAHDIFVILQTNFDKSSTSENLALPDTNKLFSANKAALNSDRKKNHTAVISNSPNTH